MYTTFYGMKINPFIKDIDTANYFESDDFKNCISRLEYLKEIKGIGMFIGSVGFGKTFTMRYFSDSLNKDLYRVIYISSALYSSFDFLKIIANELNIDVGNCYKSDIYIKIQNALIKMVKEERVQPIIIIDEAHALSKSTIEEFRVLFDFNMDSKDYTTVILVGQSMLKIEMAKTIHESLKQRLLVNYTFSGLSREEVKNYIKTRLEIAGITTNIFTEEALNALYSCSKASPRRLNSLVLNSLIIGSQKKKKIIDEEIIMMAKGEIDLT